MHNVEVSHSNIQYLHTESDWILPQDQVKHKCTHTVPAFQHGSSLDTLLCRFAVEPPYLSSGEAKLIRQNSPLKTKLPGNLLQRLQVNYSILNKKQSDMKIHVKINKFKKDQ